jgi:hypothetical protein
MTGESCIHITNEERCQQSSQAQARQHKCQIHGVSFQFQFRKLKLSLYSYNLLVVIEVHWAPNSFGVLMT